MRTLFRTDAWRTSYDIPIPAGNAQTQCLETFHSESITQIVSVLLFSLVPSTICFLVVWTWGRQVRDPGHVAFLGESRFCGLGRGICCFGGGQRHGGRSAIRMEEYSPLYNSYTPQPTANSHHATTQEPRRATNKPKGKATAKSSKGNAKSSTKAPKPKGTKASSSSQSKSKLAPESTASTSTLSTNTRSTRAPPPPALPIMSEMTQMHHHVSVTENFHTMSPFALSPSPYGVSPGPPSFAGGYEESYMYQYPGAGGGYDYSGTHTYDGSDAHLGYMEEGGSDVWSQREGDISLQAGHPQMQNVHATQSSQAGAINAQQAQLAQAPVATRGRGEYWFV